MEISYLFANSPLFLHFHLLVLLRGGHHIYWCFRCCPSCVDCCCYTRAMCIALVSLHLPLLSVTVLLIAGLRQRRPGGMEEHETRSPLQEVAEKVKRLDFHPKTKPSTVKKTGAGGVVTVVATLIILYLMISEWSDYRTVTTEDIVFVDVNRGGEEIKVYLDITFDHIPCLALSLDVVDKDGEQQDEVSLHIVRSRLTHQGQVVGHVQQGVRGSEAVEGPGFTPDADYCGSCYDVAQFLEAGTCCNTCLDLKRAYIKYGFDVQVAEQSEQCLRSRPAAESYKQLEGCRIHGHLEIKKSKGNFHVAAGRSTTSAHASHKHHVHRLDKKTLAEFNTSHSISRLHFGKPFPGVEYPLQGVHHAEDGLSQVKYLINIVPTVYEYANGNQIETYQYQATMHRLPVDVTSGHYPLPGVFFMYDFSELRIKYTEQSQYFSTFFTRVCAVVGGVFVVIGLVYNGFVYAYERATGRRMEGFGGGFGSGLLGMDRLSASA
mmetsp:Transcript_6287/g.19086  ORF Transcript_6287/g.19086 Transcript_6287/m.19086 type:complete len:490 (+) Transcript_6287:140-1609(+)